MDLSYGQVEDLLVSLHNIGERRRSALKARVKHFQRNGWPGGTNTGPGRPATYDFGRMLKLCLGFELLQVGLTPERAVDVLTENWSTVRTAASLAMRMDGMFIYCDPSALDALTEMTILDSAANAASDTFFYAGRGVLAGKFRDEPNWIRRLALVNLSLLLQAIQINLGISEEDFLAAHEAWEGAEVAAEDADT